ncbi:hypothetical protein ACQ4PT_005571 [Festuca glaucescens]
MASPTQSSSAVADGDTLVSSAVPTPTPSPSAANGTPAASADFKEVPSQTPRETEPQDAHKVAGVRRKLKSAVWDEFERVLIDGEMKAKCQWCHSKLVGETKDGTSHLRAHLATCPARQTTTAWKQAKLKLTKGEDGKVNVENYVFDQELCRKQLALMLCCHEYPLAIVDHAGFRKFYSILQPMFKVVSRQTIRKDIIEMHEGQRDKMIKYSANFKNRVAVTSDLWTAGHQRRGYMAVTAHYIDGSWNLKSFLLRFVYVPAPHTAAVLCDVLHEVLVEFHLERKISTITLDNCTTNDKVVEELQDKLDSSSLMLGAIRKWTIPTYMQMDEMSEEIRQQYEALYGSLYGPEAACTEVARVKMLLRELLVEYKDDSYAATTSGAEPAVKQGEDEVLDIFDQYMSSQPAVSAMLVHTELDLYLEEPTLPITADFDIINWWKFGGIKYPTLQLIAHDILPIPVTTVPSESTFSTSGRILSPHRSRLEPKCVEAIMCMQAWCNADMLGDNNSSLSTTFQTCLDEEDEPMDEELSTYNNY